MKTYTTFEMVDMILKEEGTEFECDSVVSGTKGKVKSRVGSGVIEPYWSKAIGCEGERFVINNYTIGLKWTLVEKPVDFITAINSGKKIKNENWGGYCDIYDTIDILSNLGENVIKSRINGKWYIED